MIASWIIAEAPGTGQTIMSFFVKGGLFMWPLLVCSIVSVTTIILRGIALREKNVMPLEIQNEIERLAPGESPERLSRIVHHDPSSLARIVRVALQHLRGPRSENVEMETLVVELISKCYYGRSSREVMPTKSSPLAAEPTPTPVV